MLRALVCFSFITIFGFAQEFPNMSQQEADKIFFDIRQNAGGDAEIIEAITYEAGSETIPQDLPRALSVYARLYKKDHNPIAAYKLGMFAWNIKKNPHNIDKTLVEMLEQIEGLNPQTYFLKGSQQAKEVRYHEVARLNGILLGIYLFDTDNISESIKAFNTRSDIANNSLSQLYLAFNYLKLKDTKMANFYLNRACFHENPEPSVVNFCKNSDSLKRTAALRQ